MSNDQAAGGNRSDFIADLLLVPNLISLGRIAGVLAGAACIFLEIWAAALVLGVVAGLTDYLDGYLARRLGQTSQLGALLDSLADILVALTCFALATYLRLWPLYLLIAWGVRDMGVLAMRASAAQQGITIPTSMLGKVAMNFTGYAYILLAFDLVRPFTGMPRVTSGVHWAGLIIIHAGIALQWAAALIYLRAYAARYRRNPAVPPVS
jgi:cardiolipin synthase